MRSGSLKICPSTDRPSIDYYKLGNKPGILSTYGLHANSEQGATSTQDPTVGIGGNGYRKVFEAMDRGTKLFSHLYNL
jgi:hypothetical protein